ncbi:YoaK family protein [Acidithiobacillus sp. AMEEHan]|uniref:YoaK family protein n=1 Tax=Acidithiobacillus sp. AMEEHan TaxID=2994951 RepID=UPI0027E4DA92|nr:YoaK family protein [Acidithiobacillus sp. AMEEHan]
MTQAFTRADLRIQLLSAIAASADVTAFLRFHDVFTSAMTGNLALLGLALGQGHLALATHSLLALVGFTLGAVAASALGTTAWGRGERILFLELLGLWIFAAGWCLWGFPVGGGPLALMILGSAVAMGTQSVLARRINVAGVPSVVFTNTLTSILIGLTEALRAGKKPAWVTVQQLTALLAYAGGAVLIAALLWFSPLLAVNLPWVALLVVWFLGRHETSA